MNRLDIIAAILLDSLRNPVAPTSEPTPDATKRARVDAARSEPAKPKKKTKAR